MHRLKTRPQFQAAMAGGTIARTAHFALHRLVLSADASGSDAAPSGPGDQPAKVVPPALFAFEATWLGAMVPKRWARRAVTRNAIKRQIYAVAALHEAQLPVAAHVVRLRSTFDRKQFISPSSDVLKQAVRAELMQLFARAHKNSLPAKAERNEGAKALSV
ncbi:MULTISPECIES: ribonuclease P protein component [Comamonas]|uniref:Ribonuclease P protein component n=1 Tax=Comamonas sediminis TaxID=1783360 RepID=A0ABV4B6B8_9BURK|nr:MULTISPECIES: ribonuclease P protein component [unclassified Comamonas]ULR91659.1 ribonuclease P protein component [Comamonas sp. B21-038]